MTFISYPGAAYQVPIDNSREEALQEFTRLKPLRPPYGFANFLVLNKYAPGRARYEVILLEKDAHGTLIRQECFYEILEPAPIFNPQ